MGRRRYDRSGQLLPLRQRQPVVFWTAMALCILLVASLLGGAVSVLG